MKNIRAKGLVLGSHHQILNKRQKSAIIIDWNIGGSKIWQKTTNTTTTTQLLKNFISLDMHTTTMWLH